MLTRASCITVTVLLLSAPATAQNRASEAPPQFPVEPFWPTPLPNNWILGQVAGIATCIRLSPDRLVYVCDRTNNRLQNRSARAEISPTRSAGLKLSTSS
jgi:hypothetical protein